MIGTPAVPRASREESPEQRRNRMFSAPFEYAAPSSLDEALSLLSERGEEAKVLHRAGRGGRTYWLCSAGCLGVFEAQPDRYEATDPEAIRS
jgi:hypothetical protein